MRQDLEHRPDPASEQNHSMSFGPVASFVFPFYVHLSPSSDPLALFQVFSPMSNSKR